MSMEMKPQQHPEDEIAFVWKAWGLLLGGIAFLLLCAQGILRGGDPTGPIAHGAGAFLFIWTLNRVLAFTLGLNRKGEERPASPDAPAEKQ